jgi:hypothetical protein
VHALRHHFLACSKRFDSNGSPARLEAISKMRWLLAGCVGLCLGVCTNERAARAHESPTAYGVVWRTDDTEGDFVVRSNRGLIFKTRSGKRLLCHGAIGAHVSEKLPVASTDDGWLVGTSVGVVHLDFEGCPDEPAPRLDVGAVQDLQRDSVGSENIYVVTATANRGSGVFRSEDDGASFVSVAEVRGDQFYNSVAFGSDGDASVYVSGASFDRETGLIEHFVEALRPLDGAERYEVTLQTGEKQVRAVNVGYDGMLVQTIASGTDPPIDRLLNSRDGGESWSTLIAAQGIRHAAAAEKGGALLLATDEGLYRSVAAGAFERISLEWAPSCVHSRGDRIVYCDALGIHTSTDPRLPETLMFFADVTEPVSCDASGAAIPECAPEWSDFEAELGGLPSSRPVIPDDATRQVDAGHQDHTKQQADAAHQDHTARGIRTSSGCALPPTGAAPRIPSLWLIAASAMSWIVCRTRRGVRSPMGSGSK